MRRHLHTAIGALLCMATFHGCKKGGCNVVPDVIFTRSIFLGEFPQLRVQGGYAVTAATEDGKNGVGGLIILNNGNQFLVYDRSSTVNVGRGCAVNVEAGGLVAKDPCSGAKYILINGSPAEIAECPLRPYRARRNGETIIISN